MAEEFSSEKDEVFIRSFLGKMLFSGDEVLKNISVLSGGEKVRCMLSKMMMLEGNVLIFDNPTNHLDLESIQALNNAMIDFSGTILFTSHDHELTQSVATRIIDITPGNMYDKLMSYNEFLEFSKKLVVGASRFELPLSRPPAVRFNRTKLYPEYIFVNLYQ